MLDSVVTRQANAQDVPFIFSSWLKSYHNSNFALSIPSTMYFKEQHKLIEQIITRSTVLVAVNPEDQSQIYGWICADTAGAVPIIHYLYVKHPYRKFGLGRMLVDLISTEPFIYTHDTGKKFTSGVYCPYMAFNK